MAARWAGIETVAFCEVNPYCRKVLHKHWPGVLKYMAIRDVAHPDHTEILTAGFPCQPFSVAGKKKGIEDDRYLWPEVSRIIGKSRPDWIILENVPGIVPCLDPILEDLESKNYAWRAYLIPASAVGAPHKRERLWIIAHCNSERCNNGTNHRQKRSFQDDQQWNIETLQSEWPQFFPQSWETFNAQEWLVASNSASITSKQADKRAITEQEERHAWIGHPRQFGKVEAIFDWQKDQPPVPGVDVWVSEGLDFINRNKAIGNCVVPQIPFIFMKLIKEIYEKAKE